MFVEMLHSQQRQLDKLLGCVESAIAARRSTANDADRKYYSYIDFIEFGQQDNTAQDIVLTVPEKDHFVATRLAFFPSFRFVSTDPTTDGANEVSFRPCIFPSYGAGLMPTIPLVPTIPTAMVDCFVSISENYRDGQRTISRNYQNLPSPVASFFSNGVNLNPSQQATGVIDNYYPTFSFPTALLFDEGWELMGGSSVTIKIAPSFAGVREDPSTIGSSPTRQNQYRVTAVLEGFKKVRR